MRSMAAQLPGRTIVFRMRPRARGQGRPLPAVLAADPPRIPARRRPAARSGLGSGGRHAPPPPAVLRPDEGPPGRGAGRQLDRRGAPRKPPPAPAPCPAVRWLQPRLFETGKDFTRFDEGNDAALQNPWLIWAIYLAHRRGEARGWKRGIRLGIRRALIIVLSGHAAGDTVCYSEIFPHCGPGTSASNGPPRCSRRWAC
jgi:hypothetical protein